MKSMKKVLALILSFSMLLGLTACGAATSSGADSGSPASTSSEAKEEQVTLYVITQRPEDNEFYSWLNAEFEKKYPNIKVSYDAVPTSDYAQLRSARIASGDVDIFVSDIKNGNPDIQMDLTGQPFLEKMYPGALAIEQYDGKQLAVHLGTLAYCVLYNPRLFEQYNVSVPTTWDEFVAACETFKNAGVEPILFGGADQWPIGMVTICLDAQVVQGANPDFYKQLMDGKSSYQDPCYVELLQKMQVIGTYFQKNAMGFAYANAPGLFAQGEYPMMIDGSWSVPQVEAANPDFQVDAFLLPGTNDPEKSTLAPVSGAMPFAVNVNSPDARKDAALKYLDFFFSKEIYQEFINKIQFFPIREEISMDAISAGTNNVNKLLGNPIEYYSTQIPKGTSVDDKWSLMAATGTDTPENIAAQLQAEFETQKAALQ